MRSQFQLLCLGDINGRADKFYDVGGLVQHRMADNVEVLDGSFRMNNTLVHVKIGFPMFAFFSGFQDAIPILRMKSLFRNSALSVSSSGLLPKIRCISGDTVTTPRCNIKLPTARVA